MHIKKQKNKNPCEEKRLNRHWKSIKSKISRKQEAKEELLMGQSSEQQGNFFGTRALTAWNWEKRKTGQTAEDGGK